MAGLIFRRFLWFIPVIFIISLVTFLLMKAAPGGPWDRDPDAKQVDPRTQKLLDQRFGLDRPLPEQYLRYMVGYTDDQGQFVCGAVCGNLGPSFRQRGKSVQDILFGVPPGDNKTFLDSKFGYSIRLGLLSLIFAMVVGVPAGVIAALKQNSAADYGITFITNIGVAVPSFVVAFFSIVVLAVGLKLIPVVQKSWAGFVPWIVPAIVFGFGTLAQTARFTRTAMLDVLRQDFIRTARAKGLQERAVIWKHTVRNALIPVVTTLGPAFVALVTGSIVIENIYGIPGVGRDFVQSIGNRDYSLIMGTTLLYAVLIVLGNLSVDILYGVIDPRIRVE
jgi:oligopeptide transport system permease protein